MDSLTATDLRAVGEFRLLARLGSGGMGQVFVGCSDDSIYAFQA